MTTWIVAAMAAVLMVSLSVSGCAKSQSERRAASPTMKERFTKETITGKVNDIGSNHVSIRESDGDTMRIRVDDRTKMDRVAVGDQVKAYVSEDGYATTIQRVTD
ncbi:MAG TPA: hypothetical protein VFS39_02225 [Nitrospira sp.]|nr:hypothetical protein [Nitrospira sp.]